jgi:hypothetical protein
MFAHLKTLRPVNPFRILILPRRCNSKGLCIHWEELDFLSKQLMSPLSKDVHHLLNRHPMFLQLCVEASSKEWHAAKSADPTRRNSGLSRLMSSTPIMEMRSGCGLLPAHFNLFLRLRAIVKNSAFLREGNSNN